VRRKFGDGGISKKKVPPLNQKAESSVSGQMIKANLAPIEADSGRTVEALLKQRTDRARQHQNVENKRRNAYEKAVCVFVQEALKVFGSRLLTASPVQKLEKQLQERFNDLAGVFDDCARKIEHAAAEREGLFSRREGLMADVLEGAATNADVERVEGEAQDVLEDHQKDLAKLLAEKEECLRCCQLGVTSNAVALRGFAPNRYVLLRGFQG
jgi:hypothetical protein